MLEPPSRLVKTTPAGEKIYESPRPDNMEEILADTIAAESRAANELNRRISGGSVISPEGAAPVPEEKIERQKAA